MDSLCKEWHIYGGDFPHLYFGRTRIPKLLNKCPRKGGEPLEMQDEIPIEGSGSSADLGRFSISLQGFLDRL